MYEEATRKREVDGLMDAIETYNLQEGLILTESDEEEFTVKDKKINVLPVWKWMLWQP